MTIIVNVNNCRWANSRPETLENDKVAGSDLDFTAVRHDYESYEYSMTQPAMADIWKLINLLLYGNSVFLWSSFVMFFLLLLNKIKIFCSSMLHNK